MLKALAIVAATAVLAISAASAVAAPKNTPGHLMQTRGSVPGHPGASGYAPGQVKKMYRAHDSRAFAPGHRKHKR